MAYRFEDAALFFEWVDANLSDDEARVLIVRIMGFCDDPWVDPDVTTPGAIPEMLDLVARPPGVRVRFYVDRTAADVTYLWAERLVPPGP